MLTESAFLLVAIRFGGEGFESFTCDKSVTLLPVIALVMFGLAYLRWSRLWPLVGAHGIMGTLGLGVC